MLPKKRILHLSVKAVYFNQIKDGTKTHEFREITKYWEKRLINRKYDEIHIKLGYPKASDSSRILIRPWKGFERQGIIHEHFNNEFKNVFAIIVNDNAKANHSSYA